MAWKLIPAPGRSRQSLGRGSRFRAASARLPLIVEHAAVVAGAGMVAKRRPASLGPGMLHRSKLGRPPPARARAGEEEEGEQAESPCSTRSLPSGGSNPCPPESDGVTMGRADRQIKRPRQGSPRGRGRLNAMLMRQERRVEIRQFRVPPGRRRPEPRIWSTKMISAALAAWSAAAARLAVAGLRRE